MKSGLSSPVESPVGDEPRDTGLESLRFSFAENGEPVADRDWRAVGLPPGLRRS